MTAVTVCPVRNRSSSIISNSARAISSMPRSCASPVVGDHLLIGLCEIPFLEQSYPLFDVHGGEDFDNQRIGKFYAELSATDDLL